MHRPMLNPRHVFGLLVLLLLVSADTKAAGSDGTINISIDRSRVARGETVKLRANTPGGAASPGNTARAVLLQPTIGATGLTLQAVPGSPNSYSGQVVLAADAPEGVYVIHVWTGQADNPSAVGKATFLLGRVVADFFIAPYLDETQPAQDLEDYLREFRQVGGNFLVAHNLITPTKVYFPSKIAKTNVGRGSSADIVELVLSRADKYGYAVLLSVSWDMTRQSPYKSRMEEIKGITEELYSLYKHHPSLAGFYSYQEGSGTYFVPYVREFSEHVKSINRNLLTACAPHMDDPLLAGYLSTVEDLDILFYQTGVMASYRTDNRKKYPFRRVKDFCSLAAAAKRLQNKISINHVELFGYLENRLNPDTTATTYENIYQQILSAATVTDADGISFFSFHAHIHLPLKKLAEAKCSRAAVSEGMKAFNLITSRVSNQRNHLTVYFPYSDWIIERWSNYFLPALDAFRVLGVPVDVLPYAPPVEESVYPYYPFHMNQDVLDRLLKEDTVLILPNVSGFQQTDSDLIKAFVEQGGVIVAFGRQIPMGRSYERAELFGGDEGKGTATHTEVIVREAIGKRAQNGRRFPLTWLQLPTWTLKGAHVISTFENGSPSITTQKYGRGTIVTILPDAWTAAQYMPELTRDVLEYAGTLRGNLTLVDIVGTNENTDMVVASTRTGFRVAVVNYNSAELEIMLKPLTLAKKSESEWIELVTNNKIGNGPFLKVGLPGNGFRAFEYRVR
jgi:Domain of unknown function (DUF4434)